MRLQPLQALVADIELKKIPSIIKERNRNAQYLDANLAVLGTKIVIPMRNSYDVETYSLYMILCERRDELLEYLQRKRIDAKVHYPVPLHLQEAAKELGYGKGSFPVTESQASTVITLPAHQFLDVSQLDYMVASIKEFYS